MMNVLGILSMLHEPTRGSATRLFRGKPVLHWTLQRLSHSKRLTSSAILCWDDQARHVAPLAEEWGAQVVMKGTRSLIPSLEAISAAQRWADGWRGGLLATCRFDLGFYGPFHAELTGNSGAEAVVLVDPSAGLVDPQLVDALVAHADSHEAQEFCFMPAAPGLSGVLIRQALLKRLAQAKAHPGRLLYYFDDQLGKEPLATDSCVALPAPVARTSNRFTLDSERQVRRISAATGSLNGQLLGSSAEDLVRQVAASHRADLLPREVVLELNLSRATRPIFWPGRTLSLDRGEFGLELTRSLFEVLGSLDDTRLTLAGVGDPLLCDNVFAVIDAARRAGVAVNLETDLVGISTEALSRLAASGVDVVSVHLPALSAQTYAAVMGVDRYAEALENVKRLLLARQSHAGTTPIVVPIFTKCQQNFPEMEPWYDQWLRALGSAVIRGPSSCAGQIPDLAMADMSPPGRLACGRISSRAMILSDGRVVSCEEDVAGAQVMGRLQEDALGNIWEKQFETLRKDHRIGEWGRYPLCKGCREWHRG